MIGIAAGILIVAVAAIAITIISNNSENVVCEYKTTEGDSFDITVNDKHRVFLASSGQKYVDVEGKLTNKQDSNKISYNGSNFKLKSGETLYSCIEYFYPPTDLSKGESTEIELVFKIPSSAASYELVWVGEPDNVKMIRK